MSFDFASNAVWVILFIASSFIPSLFMVLSRDPINTTNVSIESDDEVGVFLIISVLLMVIGWLIDSARWLMAFAYSSSIGLERNFFLARLFELLVDEDVDGVDRGGVIWLGSWGKILMQILHQFVGPCRLAQIFLRLTHYLQTANFDY